MSDTAVTIEQLKEKVALFVREREWDQFHSPKNLSMALAVESAELMEKFLWIENNASYEEIEKNRQEIEQELGDVVLVLLAFCNASNIDVSKAFEDKLRLTCEKYPVEKVKGRYDKYTWYK